MELFVAVNFGEEVLDALSAVQGELCRLGCIAPGELEYRGDLHLTLRYLGRQNTEHQIVKELRSVAFSPLSLSLSSLGVFYNQDQTVIWSGVTGDLHVLRALKYNVDHSLAAVETVPRVQHFFPHITLAALRPGARVEPELLRRAAPVPAAFRVGAFHLYAICRETGYPRFEKLETFTPEGRNQYA